MTAKSSHASATMKYEHSTPWQQQRATTEANSSGDTSMRDSHATRLDYFEDKWLENDNGCHIWQGSLDKDGYGYFWDGKTVKAHRWAYETFVADVGDKLVLHHCDTPSCVNVEHLFLGDYQDNHDDMRSKDRQNYEGYRVRRSYKGSNNPRAVLTPDEVAEIRRNELGLSQRKLAELYNVSKSQIGNIQRRNQWT